MSERMRRWLLLLEAACCAVLVRVLLRLVSLRGALRVVRVAPFPFVASASVAECAAAAAVACGRFAHATCLYRALVAFALLSRREHTTCFHLGTARSGDLAAHAWVSANGHTTDAEAGHYALLWTAAARIVSR